VAFWLRFLGVGKESLLDRVWWLSLGRLGFGWAGRLILLSYYYSIVICAILGSGVWVLSHDTSGFSMYEFTDFGLIVMLFIHVYLLHSYATILEYI
jgi:hypothetical protein